MMSKFIYKLILSSFICITLTGARASAQQDFHYILESFAAFRSNPAYTGDKELNDLILMTRQQWTGFKGAPTSYLLATHFSMRDKNASIGTDIQNNSTCPLTETQIFIDYSYKVVLGENTSLYLGLKGGAGIMQINFSDLVIIDPGDKMFETDVNNIILPNLGSGLHFVYRQYYLDLSVPNMIRNSISPSGVPKVNNENRQERTFIIGGGAKFQLTDGLILHPAISLWLSKGTPLLFETRVSATFRKLGVGIVYQPVTAIGGFLDYGLWDDIKIGYAFELPTTALSGAQSGSHEIYLGYTFSFTKQKTLSPRRF
jgi:type IX secretion system PorP/SprF family membrane protein